MKRTTAIGPTALLLLAPSFLVQSLSGARPAMPRLATAALPRPCSAFATTGSTAGPVRPGGREKLPADAFLKAEALRALKQLAKQ